MNNIDLITDALREIGVVDRHRSPSPEDAKLSLRKLNVLMANLERDGIDLGYFTQTDVNDELPLDDADAAAVMPLFAMFMTINYPSQQVPQTLPTLAAANRQQLLREAVLNNAEEATLENMPLGEGRCSTYNIQTGE